jgi:hypothetical protein
MNKEILKEIENAKQIYHLVLTEIRRYAMKIVNSLSSFSDLDIMFLEDLWRSPSDKTLKEKLHKITGKDTAIISSCISDFIWESGFYDEEYQDLSFKISLPEPKIFISISPEELFQIYEIVKRENYWENANDYIERRFFMYFNNYFEKILEINLEYLLSCKEALLPNLE